MPATYSSNVLEPVVRDPALPDVFVLGDSISMQWMPYARDTLSYVCNIHRPPENCQHSRYGLENLLRSWISPCIFYKVIVFNFGLHESVIIAPETNRIPIDEYPENLESIISILRTFSEKLLWIRTTDVPEGSLNRTEANTQTYNDAADLVMAGHPDISVLDLHAYTAANPDWHIAADVHFLTAGAEALGDIVAANIVQRLSNG